jgi:polar amino acid transport system substrate-binding protein
MKRLTLDQARRTLLVTLTCLVAVGAAAAIASGAQSRSETRGAAGVDVRLRNMLPADIRSSGVIQTATNAEYPPYEYLGSDGKTVLGIDPDLAAAVGKLLGIKIQFVNLPWSSVIPGVQAGRYVMAWSDATDLKSREKTVDILDYVRQGQGFMWKKGGTAINTVTDACGLKVAVNQGSDAVGYVQSITKKCTAGGKPAIQMQSFPSQDTSVLAVKSGRVDATVNATETNAWVAQHSGGTLVSGGPTFFDGVSGIVFPKHSPLLKVMRLALAKLRADGSYQKVFAKYGIPSNVIKSFTVNGALS